MKTIETTIVIEPDGKLIMQLPPIDVWPTSLSLRREDLYDNFGR